jgi:hypothetical protein
LSAQTLVKENKMWSNTWIGTDFGWPYGVQYESYYIKFQGDTLINNVTYKNILRSDDENHINWYKYGAIREDSTQKVYTYNTYGHVGEILLYNFGVKIGDTIKANPWETLYVTNIENIKLENFSDSIRKIVFDNYYTWLEGIGSVTNDGGGILIGLPEIGMLGKYPDIVCYFENDTLKYSNTKFESCFPNHIVHGIKENINELPVIKYSDNQIIVSYNNFISPGSRLKIFSITGITLSNTLLNSSGETVISADIFPPGCYIYSIMLENHLFNGIFVVGHD